MRSRPPTGRSSTTSSSRPASRRSLRPNAGCRRSPTATSASTRRRWPAATHLAGAHLLSPVPNRALVADPPLQPDRADLRRDPPQDQGDRPPTGRAVLPVAGVGGAGPGWPRLAGCRPDSGRGAPAPGPTPSTPPPTGDRGGGCRGCHPRRIGSAIGSPRPPLFHHQRDATHRSERSPCGGGHPAQLASCLLRSVVEDLCVRGVRPHYVGRMHEILLVVVGLAGKEHFAVAGHDPAVELP